MVRALFASPPPEHFLHNMISDSTSLDTPPKTLDRDDFFQISRLWVSYSTKPLHRPLLILDHFFEKLCELTESHNAFCVLALCNNENPTLPLSEDPLDGWRATESMAFRGSQEERTIGFNYRDSFEYAKDEITVANVAQAGQHRAFLIEDLIGEDTPRDGMLFWELLKTLEIEDRIVGTHTLCPTVEFFIGLDRLEGSPHYTTRERDLLLEVMRGMRTLATRLFMSFGLLPGQESLTPREQTALHLLLDGLSEKEVGAAMGITPASAHQYAVSIYRKLGVNSRPQLLNLWLDPPSQL